jgi:hypothetical protein
VTHNRQAPVDDLVILCAHDILAGGEECTFERLVYECFTRFPESFCLLRYPQWPDSARVNKAWLRCRTDKGWLAGNVKQGFRLTPAGKRAADRVQRSLEQGGARPKPPSRPRERYEVVLERIRKSDLFHEFASKRDAFNPSTMALRDLLGTTLETPVRVLKMNLRLYADAARAYGDTDVTEFIAACERLLEIKSTSK